MDTITNILVCYFFASLIAFIIVLIIWGIDYIITRKRLKENQKAWDEYSKGMTMDEKDKAYMEWCRRRRYEKRWEFFYFPRM